MTCPSHADRRWFSQLKDRSGEATRLLASSKQTCTCEGSTRKILSVDTACSRCCSFIFQQSVCSYVHRVLMEMKVAAIAVAMLATVLFPQPGYIHPDEFFQSVEIVAGDVFNISHTRAWEFNQKVGSYLLL
ncbi:hypothetical protein BaRGS_00019476 [Batillaria attramentaria]|uniref:Uncharacterized protein n=1 Tax=Batillaria attramentaria TaxID=370345 RepID=A0ABD0KQ41_9CAEN